MKVNFDLSKNIISETHNSNKRNDLENRINSRKSKDINKKNLHKRHKNNSQSQNKDRDTDSNRNKNKDINKNKFIDNRQNKNKNTNKNRQSQNRQIKDKDTKNKFIDNRQNRQIKDNKETNSTKKSKNKNLLVPRNTNKISLPPPYNIFTNPTIQDYQTILVILFLETRNLKFIKELILFSSNQRNEHKKNCIICLADLIIEGGLIESLFFCCDLQNVFFKFLRDCLNCPFIGLKCLSQLLMILQIDPSHYQLDNKDIKNNELDNKSVKLDRVNELDSKDNKIENKSVKKENKNKLTNKENNANLWKKLFFTILYQIRLKTSFNLLKNLRLKRPSLEVLQLLLKMEKDFLFKKRIIEILEFNKIDLKDFYIKLEKDLKFMKRIKDIEIVKNILRKKKEYFSNEKELLDYYETYRCFEKQSFFYRIGMRKLFGIRDSDIF